MPVTGYRGESLLTYMLRGAEKKSRKRLGLDGPNLDGRTVGNVLSGEEVLKHEQRRAEAVNKQQRKALKRLLNEKKTQAGREKDAVHCDRCFERATLAMLPTWEKHVRMTTKAIGGAEVYYLCNRCK